MIYKVFILFSITIILSCASSKPNKYTLIITYKEHRYLNDTAKPAGRKETFIQDNNVKAYSYGILRFASLASRWNDTAFWAPIEPISFQVMDEKNVDIKTQIDKDNVRMLDSLMSVNINQQREAISKSKEDFLKKVDTMHGGLRNQLDSLIDKNSKN